MLDNEYLIYMFPKAYKSNSTLQNTKRSSSQSSIHMIILEKIQFGA